MDKVAQNKFDMTAEFVKRQREHEELKTDMSLLKEALSAKTSNLSVLEKTSSAPSEKD